MNRSLYVIALFITVLQLSSCADYYTKTDTAENFPGAAKQEYVPGTEDIPVYHGFMAINDNIMAYDSVSGRIIDAVFYSENVPVRNVQEFYDTTLPQLGWSKQKSQIYERDGEKLKLNIIERSGKTLLKFTIRPNIS